MIHCAYTDLVDIASVVPNPRNPNHHSDKQVELLAKVIKAQGWRAPITVSNRSGFIVRGHGRLMAAQLLGLDTVPIDRQDYESEAAEYADLIADNRIAELSDIDNTLLGELLADTGDFAEFTGYSDDDIANLLNQVMADEVHEDDFDAEDAIKSIKEPMTKFGDVWMLGEHMLLCGDSTKTESLDCLRGGMLLIWYLQTHRIMWLMREVQRKLLPFKTIICQMLNLIYFLMMYSLWLTKH